MLELLNTKHFPKTMSSNELCDNLVVVGVLALQGAFIEHIDYFEDVVKNKSYANHQFEFIEVRTSEQLKRCDGLVIPGGESTSISLIAERTNLLNHLYLFIADETKVVWGTCAGLIFLSREVLGGKPDQKLLGGLNIRCIRNAFGRQIDSFMKPLDFSSFIPGMNEFPAVFIRAPVVDRITDNEPDYSISIKDDSQSLIISDNQYQNKFSVEILHQLHNGDIVAVRQGNKLGTSFHPELGDDNRFHKWFLDEFVLNKKK